MLDELFDLALYQALRDVAPPGPLQSVLDRMIPIERRHVKFWQDYFGLPLTSLGARRRIELALLVGVCRLFGAPAIHLVLEAIEVYGVRKYLAIWETAEGTPLEPGLRGILRDEFEHEDAVVTGDDEHRINPERMRNIFLGLNDGLVEILGAVSGFFGAFGDPATVLIAGTTTAVAGSLSMAAGAFVATSSESEVRETELARRRFLGEAAAAQEAPESPLGSAGARRRELSRGRARADAADRARRAQRAAVRARRGRRDRRGVDDPRVPLRHEHPPARAHQPRDHRRGRGDQLRDRDRDARLSGASRRDSIQLPR